MCRWLGSGVSSVAFSAVFDTAFCLAFLDPLLSSSDLSSSLFILNVVSSSEMKFFISLFSLE